MQGRLKIGFLCLGMGLACSVAAQDSSPLTDASALKAPTISKPADSCAPKRNPEEWVLSGSFGFNMTQGNVSSNLIYLDAKADREKDGHIWNFQLQGATGEQEDEKTQEFLRGDAGYKYLLTERTYVGMGVTALTDQIVDVDYRVFLNPAVGYYFWKSEDFKLSGEVGPSVIFEKQGPDSESFFAPRLADKLEWQISPTSKLFQAAEMYFNTSDSDDFLLNAEAGIEAAIMTQLSLVLAVRDRFDNQPADGREKNDVIIVSALKFAL